MSQNPYEVEMAGVAKEIGGNLTIEYHTLQFKITCEQLQVLKEKGMPTDVMSCIIAGLYANGKTEDDIKAFLEEAKQAGANPSVIFDAPDDGALNIKSKEENPMLDVLVQAVEHKQ